jgi:hypothetical protein
MVAAAAIIADRVGEWFIERRPKDPAGIHFQIAAR